MIPSCILAFFLIIAICLKIKEELEIKEGKNFTRAEKKMLLRAFSLAREERLSDDLKRGLCQSIQYNMGYIVQSSVTYDKLCALYHRPSYYNSHGLSTYEDTFRPYWWPLSDTTSRLKALDILEQAIIND